MCRITTWNQSLRRGLTASCPHVSLFIELGSFDRMMVCKLPLTLILTVGHCQLPSLFLAQRLPSALIQEGSTEPLHFRYSVTAKTTLTVLTPKKLEDIDKTAVRGTMIGACFHGQYDKVPRTDIGRVVWEEWCLMSKTILPRFFKSKQCVHTQRLMVFHVV